MKQKLLKRLNTFLKENEMLGTPATDEQIEQAEKELGIKFSADYIVSKTFWECLCWH